MGHGYRLASLLLAISFAVLTGACQPIEEHRADNDPIESANRKIDQGKYTEAIDDLEAELAKHEGPRTRSVLASAYAARAGLLVESHWAFLSSFETPRGSQISGRVRASKASAMSDFYKIIMNIQQWSDRIDSLPVLNEDGRQDVQNALQVLAPDQGRGSRLYSALLGFVLLRSDLDQLDGRWAYMEKYVRSAVAKTEETQSLAFDPCSKEVGLFARDAGGLMLQIQNIMLDLKAAYPSKAADIDVGLIEMQKSTKSLKSFNLGSCK